MQLKYLMKKNYSILLLFYWDFILPQFSVTEEKIEVIPIFQTLKGLSGNNFNYQEGKA